MIMMKYLIFIERTHARISEILWAIQPERKACSMLLYIFVYGAGFIMKVILLTNECIRLRYTLLHLIV